ncbi:MAG: (2Fe-2S)-binding protein [Thaumarchaeota archaeon]|nr:(2Fe-2S)-binding protein [Nitrososphaerota archaeon]|tara:strand:- start:1765 stop:2376 length:612 start_codon:yes stop_codon:yes gene_type:complete
MSKQPSEKDGKLSRRDFLKIVAAAGTIMTFTPFIDWGKFMPNPAGTSTERAKVILPDSTQANVNTFPVNYSEAVIYPTTGDRVLDEEPFRRWQFIRLPSEFGGDKNDVSAFRAFSMVCLHLWCLWKYYPDEKKKRGECPCHGSMYDARNGKAVAGPAALQAPPSNVLPKLDLEVDSDGFLWIPSAVWNVNSNGIVGYGRFIRD